jgi:hypothetical protein
MSHLAEVQANFQAYLLGHKQGDAFIKQIVDDKKVGAKLRLGIYYDAYRLRIIEVLSNVYPNLKQLLGDDLFEQSARAYIDVYPSTYRNMRWVGDKMALHLNNTLPQHPIAAEMATFEWALGLAFDAEDAPVLQLQDLAIIPPEQWADLKFNFHPSMRLLWFNYNVVEVWQALDNEDAPPAVMEAGSHCLVWRHMSNSYFRLIDNAEWHALQFMCGGGSFAGMCEQLTQECEDQEGAELAAMNQAAQYMSIWLSQELISAFDK